MRFSFGALVSIPLRGFLLTCLLASKTKPAVVVGVSIPLRGFLLTCLGKFATENDWLNGFNPPQGIPADLPALTTSEDITPMRVSIPLRGFLLTCLRTLRIGS